MVFRNKICTVTDSTMINNINNSMVFDPTILIDMMMVEQRKRIEMIFAFFEIPLPSW